MKQFKEKLQMEQDNYWKSIVEDLKSERDIFKNELQSKENEWKAERDALKSERDTFKAERDIFKAERDIFKAEINVFKTERDNLLLENFGLRRMLMGRDRVRRVGFQHHSMIEHLIIWLKAPPQQIGIGSTPETGRRKFID
ncbi:hypothetical protein TNCV_3536261 [Trichonephila clavipes]|uniref:Uncharacterized protein n=1 Tax=Trichonephila clavipes TaxID=2585209 RepID=A0A8X6VWQ7_TRICX|nr:hypothetical protein TNCV_3536261 [Trichonephila clavipes]